MKKIFKIIFVFITAFTFSSLLNKVHAQPEYTYPSYNVTIDINKDSTFTVREEATYQFYGTVHGVRRDIKLINNDCFQQQVLTCGGFDRIEVQGVYDENDKKLDPSQYTLSTYEDDNSNKFFRVERVLFPNGKEFSGEKVKWAIVYKIYGGLKWFGVNPMFYWNALPEELGGDVDVATVEINLPQDASYKSSSFQIYNDFNSDPDTSVSGNKITMVLQNLFSSGAFTVSYKFEENEIVKPASVNFNITSPYFDNHVLVNNVDATDQSQDTLNGIPAGKSQITFQHTGYKDKVIDLDLVPGETKNINVALDPESWMSILLLINTLGFILGLCFVPLSIFYVIYRYISKGKDKDMPKTIIPLFSPPENTPPYLLGTIKDETVDREDITGSIIDLAYRGYIKIKEIKKGLFGWDMEYELTRLQGKKGDKGLNDLESYLMDALFGDDDTVLTSSLRYKFPMKYLTMQKMIYKEVVDKGFFSKSPESVRGNYLGCGIFFLVIGILILCASSIFGSGFVGYLVICSPALGLVILGIGFIIAAKFMPAKTAAGSKVYADILGFRMYLYTAERYRLQNLTPEEFEKYLSYAIVFKIEKQWADKFKDIYKKMPDWYEGDPNALWDAYFVSNMIRTFSNSTITNMTPISSSGSSGGGWGGGGGSFGGFSGGGGGGGSSGGF